MLTLALDVDGVLLDSDRDGNGHWTTELIARLGIEPSQMRDAFFAKSWGDVVNGRCPIEDRLAVALAEIGASADVEAVLSCWFDADYVPFEASFDLARRSADAGHRVVLATNQEHRRAAYLRRRIGAVVPLDQVIYSADVGHQKHDHRFFSIASQRLGVRRSERSTVVFVDDSKANVEVASSFGWSAVHATGDGMWRGHVAELLQLGS